jgi:hypothetical protein
MHTTISDTVLNSYLHTSLSWARQVSQDVAGRQAGSLCDKANVLVDAIKELTSCCQFQHYKNLIFTLISNNLEKLQIDEHCYQLYVSQHIIRMQSSIATATTLVCPYNDKQQATCRLTAVQIIWRGIEWWCYWNGRKQERGRDLMEIISRNLPGKTEEYCKKVRIACLWVKTRSRCLPASRTANIFVREILGLRRSDDGIRNKTYF